MPLRVVMMGTGTFALPAFEALLNSDHRVTGLVTQPDRRGRGHHNHVNEMKEVALRHEVPVFQPDHVNQPESLAELQSFAADLVVVAAYGQILSAELLAIPRLGAINLHGSLLPKYRGAAPVQYAVLNGERETGVTIFQIEPKLDTGPILGVIKTEILPKETSGQLHDRLAELAPTLTLQVLNAIEKGTVEFNTQHAESVTKAPKIRKEEGLVDWTKTSREIYCHVFGMQPWPMPFTFMHLPQLKSSRLILQDVDILNEAESVSVASLNPGQLHLTDQRIWVRTGDGAIEIQQLQPAGKRSMSASDFLRGTAIGGGTFGAELLR